MKRLRLGALSMVLALSGLAGEANAALVSADGGLAVYDTVTNLTWLSNANLAATNTFGVSGIGASGPGLMNYATALAWIAAMNTANYLGVNTWQLPTTPQADPGCSLQVGAPRGTGCTGSMMGYLYLTDGITAAAPGLFTNLKSNDPYWSSTVPTSNTTNAFTFWFTSQQQTTSAKTNAAVYALPVLVGNVFNATVVPVPAAAWLFGSALGLIGALRRKSVA